MPGAAPFAPLDGIRVVDVTTSLAGPYCTELLAALGADVVKIEPRSGDEARHWGPPWWGDESAMFLAMNCGKRSLALDLRRGREVVERLVAQADVFVQSLRPGLAEELGLGAETLRAANPRLVYVTIAAYGRRGPLSRAPGYDPLVQGFAGILSVTGEPGRPPVRLGISAIDQGTGILAALGIVSALHERERTGVGRTLDLSLFETALALMSYHLTGYLGSGAVPGPNGTAFPSIAPYQAFEAADGPLMVVAANDGLFARLCGVIGRPELADDERFRGNPDRVRNRAELTALIEAELRREPRATWVARLAEAGVPAAPVQDVAELVRHEQTAAVEMLQELAGKTVVAPPLAADGERVRHRSPAPDLGADTAAILGELGYSEDEVERLTAGAVAGPA
jgi:crotonobetainyl-CoA:carnitine CoA-transferase CaiB-like acyl-CoA transferase